MKYIFSVIAILTLFSCKKDFTDRELLDGTTVQQYFNSAEEVRGFTSTLYGLPWYDFENRAMDAIGDVMAGNEGVGGGNTDLQFINFSFAGTSQRINESWDAFYKISGWASEYLGQLELKKSLGGNASFIDPGIAECHFIKGVAYFYIGRIWGDAPIIGDPGKEILSSDKLKKKYFQKDVLRYALEELRKAEAGLPETDKPGRVTKYSAKGMMAKLYLYQKDYDSAKIKALEVIKSGKYDLFPDYRAMFNSSANNNNIECLFSIQHQLTNDPWGSGNSKNSDRGPSNLQTDQAMMWGLYTPSCDIIDSAYESGDLRKRWSMMQHGWTMESWKPTRPNNDGYNTFMANGYRYDTLQPSAAGGIKNDYRANIAKYVVGPGSKYGGEPVLGMMTGINTIILRYADILLIYAESVLGKNGSTSDVDALAAFNRIRARAGLPLKTSINMNDILKERRVEFAFEGDYWFDIQRQGFAKAKEIIENQNRGSRASGKKNVTFLERYMYLPIPTSEILQSPSLGEPAVNYY